MGRGYFVSTYGTLTYLTRYLVAFSCDGPDIKLDLGVSRHKPEGTPPITRAMTMGQTELGQAASATEIPGLTVKRNEQEKK